MECFFSDGRMLLPSVVQGPAVLSSTNNSNLSRPSPLVIPTGANPDFLLRAASDEYVCGSPQREPHGVHQRHGSQQEIRGSAVEGSAVCPAAFPNLG
jgi:hypothetical protein